ncbi:MAG: 2-hydroxyglutaryl-CoA dehydratase [Alphaproteobacteria bacterium]
MHSIDSADTLASKAGLQAFEEIEGELRAFEAEERGRLGLEGKPQHWRDPISQRFVKDQRAHTTLLFGGLTALHDVFLEAGFGALGYRAKALACPDKEALQYGKEFGNRAQCNPTYFTVGNLIKHLTRLRDVEGISAEEIVKNHVLVTFGACGPCRFGTYVTEYRKALRDAGFEGFRVFPIKKDDVQNVLPEEQGLDLGPRFALMLFKCLLAGDVLNAIGYRTRPYEVVAGATDAALEECKALVSDAIAKERSVLRALWRCRRVLAKVEVNRLQPKPKVAIIGEFWAMTTEGDGNYRLQRFLESEGAECHIQLITNWALYEIWTRRNHIRARMMLRRRQGEKHRGDIDSPLTGLFLFWLLRVAVERSFYAFARAVGLKDYSLPDMDHLARISRQWYPSELGGGEGHLEVADVIDMVTRKKVHMVVSVKPFGCMPSSAVSDGIQSLVTARYPEANFCPVETSGDGAVSVYSRVQMALFKARAKAQVEFEKALEAVGLSMEEAARKAAASGKLRRPVHYPRHTVAGTAANAAYELA